MRASFRGELLMGRLAAAQCRALLACLAASAIGARAVGTECVESPGRVLRACVSVDADGAPTSSPDHLTILPFTRMLSGPMDFTPGIFDVTFGHTQINERVQSTIATQLAEYVVLYSPIQMAADRPKNYRARPDAFRFTVQAAGGLMFGGRKREYTRAVMPAASSVK